MFVKYELKHALQICTTKTVFEPDCWFQIVCFTICIKKKMKTHFT